MRAVDPLPLAQALIRCPSVTPEDAGALAVLCQALEPLGFMCTRLQFQEPGTAAVENLFARRGAPTPSFCFAGHTDVVPVGDVARWSVDPFAAVVKDGRLWGRGAADMKAAIACFVAAVTRFLNERGDNDDSPISLLITGDEEGPSVNGTVQMLPWLEQQGERLAACVVGEPTNPHVLGEMIKVGRRGSLNAQITVRGTQGHSAYPHLADNPIPRLIRLLADIDATPLDTGSDRFQPSTIAMTSIDVGNPATNVIPAQATARLNVRFNDHHSGAGIRDWLQAQCDAAGGDIALATECSAEPFLCPPGPLLDHVIAAIRMVTAREPDLSTSGGTSDARFIKDWCPVCEFGLAGGTAHKADENVLLADMESLTCVYHALLDGWFRQAKG